MAARRVRCRPYPPRRFSSARRGGEGGAGLRGEQQLVGSGEAHDPGRQGLGDAIQLDGLGAPCDVFGRVLAQHHRAQVQARPGRQPAVEGVGELGEGVEVAQGIADRVVDRLEDQQEAVGLVDLAAAVGREQVAGHPVVRRPDRRGAGGPQLGGHGGAVGEVDP
jgi:hypothetical protein